EPTTVQAFDELVGALGERCTPVDLPEMYEEGIGALRTLMLASFARNLGSYYDRGRDALSETLRAAIEEGRQVAAVDYLAALDWRAARATGLDRSFDRFDAIVTPATPGEAPLGLEATGNPAFCSLWTLCGVPAVSLPLLEGPNGMPIGVQLVGRGGQDG